jgi:hypothetical protein
MDGVINEQATNIVIHLKDQIFIKKRFLKSYSRSIPGVFQIIQYFSPSRGAKPLN